MYTIVEKKQLTPLIYSLWVEAPRIAASAKPGQFLIVRPSDNGERVPLTICDYNPAAGTVRIVVQIAGVSSNKICNLNAGDCLTDVAGPLGKPSDFMDIPEEDIKARRYLFVAGGVGAAPVYPQAKYLHERGAHVDVIIGARNKDLIIMEDEMRKVCTNLYICTDDGSKGEKGVVTLLMERLCAPMGENAPDGAGNGTTGAKMGENAPDGAGNGTMGALPYDMCVAIGPMIMMKFATLTAKKLGLPITVSLNTLMVDGTGMCGACRVSVAGKTMFACVDGPEFNGYDIDFDEALRRQTLYRKEEQQANAAAGLELRR
ncbi:MAG: sulfide/dihydroorotate dehydrogenase-like FAD/NAD-binding protein [Bacteroidales bacterium]|nr:sulfide/dihydroorotate dehydrogenase-like FAD/NAD-binding protein [Bacteroidales bacterium]